MRIFDCEDFEVIRRVGQSDFLMVTFSSLGMFTGDKSMADGSRYWGQALAEKYDLSAIGFVAKRRDWFCSSYMPEACKLVREITCLCSSVVTYGSSMGGYGALRWGKECGADVTVAFSPQASIDAREVGDFDTRFNYAFDEDKHTGMMFSDENASNSVYLFVDPTCPEDLGHAKLISSRVPWVEQIDLKYCGHESIRVFAKSHLTLELLALASKRATGSIRKLAFKTRRTSAVRAAEIAYRLANDKPLTAQAILAEYRDILETSQQIRIESRLREKNLNFFDERTASCKQASLPKSMGSSTGLAVDEHVKRKTLRLVHLHVPKTAGTALRTAFERQFRGKLRVFPHWHEAKYEEVNPDDFDFYSGHIGFDTAEKLKGDIITVLRHPVDRFVSVYFFWRQLYETGVEKSINTRLAALYSLDEFVQIRDQPGLLEEFENRSTFQLASGSSLSHRRELRLKGMTEDDILNQAIRNLSTFKVVGIQEDIRKFSADIKHAYNVNLQVENVNVTKNRQAIEDISIRSRRTIQNWVYMDLELYQYALRARTGSS